ncbi:MAG: Rne/Rng family ribonuclease [Terracidiphilus sp.]|nr:Rne/Rng family ribonuclease [Terracidiphilus sp.]
MAKEICISSTPHETRLAILEDDQLAEIYYERENEYTLAGSIYNGKVTRVLPGMQSAFVDVGLERDAFLYVTDFMELDDTEETDELEKAAATGANTPPREVRHTAPRAEERPEARPEARPQARPEAPAQVRPEPRSEARPEGRSDGRSEGRGRRDRRDRTPREPRAEQPHTIILEGGDGDLEETELVATEATAIPIESTNDSPEEASGGRRWRGRRNRRGRGRSQSDEEQSPFEETVDTVEAASEPAAEPQTAPRIHASAHREPARREPVAEPITEYILAPSAPPVPAPSAPIVQREPRRSHAAVPEPFVLPGESLSRYGAAPAEEAATPAPAAPARPTSAAKPSTLVVEVPLVWDGSGLLPGESISKHRNRQPEPAAEAASGAHSVVEEFEPFEEESAADLAAEEAAEEEAEDDIVEEELVLEFDEEDADDLEPAKEADAKSSRSASHNVDPASPSGFRLFGFGKKKDEPEAAPAQVKKVSAYAPGAGHVEEETIEGEEFEVTPKSRRHRREAADLDDYEEQTLASRKREGGTDEGLEEARRIQLGANEEEEDEEETGTAAQPRRSDRGERGGRGRGRRGQPQAGGNRRGGPSRRSMQTTDLPVISDLLKPGQEILVQIAKEPIAKKGARITSHIALPGRFLVFMPTVNHVGVSRKIASDEERHRLKRILVHERGEATGGFIVRTAAEGTSEEELRADLRFLMNLWNEIKSRSDSSKSPALIYHDLSLIERILRDQVSSNFSNIWVDSEANYERIVRFLNRFSPTLVRRVKLYTKETPMFEHFGIEDEISKALRSKVWLKSGGSIVINQTEALVAIDINTGKYVGKSARLEDTIVKTNLDAVPEIVRQIRLRDLGGIIVIDFIDMDERKNRFKVLAALEEALKADRAPTKVLQFNDFGLVAITRKRVKQSLERTLSVPCPTCQATGMVKSPVTVANEIYVELRKMKKNIEGPDILLRVHPETVKVLKQNSASWLLEFEELTGKNILVKSDATLHPEQFDIQG